MASKRLPHFVFLAAVLLCMPQATKAFDFGDLVNALFGWFFALIAALFPSTEPFGTPCESGPNCLSLTIDWIDIVHEEGAPITVKIHDADDLHGPKYYSEVFGLQVEGTTITRKVAVDPNGCYELSFDNNYGIGRVDLKYEIAWDGGPVVESFDGTYYDFFTGDEFGECTNR